MFRILLPLVLAGLAACFSARSATQLYPDQLCIRIVNQHGADLTTYLVAGNTRRRLGLVTMNDRERFCTDVSLADDLRIMVDPVGMRSGVTYTTERLRLGPGQNVTVYVARNLQSSQLAISPGGH